MWLPQAGIDLQPHMEVTIPKLYNCLLCDNLSDISAVILSITLNVILLFCVSLSGGTASEPPEKKMKVEAWIRRRIVI